MKSFLSRIIQRLSAFRNELHESGEVTVTPVDHTHTTAHATRCVAQDTLNAHPPRWEMSVAKRAAYNVVQSQDGYLAEHRFKDETIGLEAHVHGNSPVEGDGMLRGYPFYFRARHAEWSFTLSLDPEVDPCGLRESDQPGFFIDGEHSGYGLWDYFGSESDASYMHYADAEAIIRYCAQRFLFELARADS
ncbi:hypothetical protein [Lysobacter brunescens]|uniref:Uncharacterized protein n=1 Tax=Lysobacter brunescens TaxID=262323 RepID=A0ABW2Y6S0_9GAMM